MSCPGRPCPGGLHSPSSAADGKRQACPRIAFGFPHIEPHRISLVTTNQVVLSPAILQRVSRRTMVEFRVPWISGESISTGQQAPL